MTRAFFPPATIGIIGGGQLGMMTIREAQRMGYRSVVWDPDPLCPASRLADETITAPFGDHNAGDRFASHAEVITYEFEHIDAEIVQRLEQHTPVRPGHEILRVSQNRKIEKETLVRHGFPVADYAIVRTKTDVQRVVRSIGLPLVLKSTIAGYDGKGQTVLRTDDDVAAFSAAEGAEFAAEQFIDLACEVSVVTVRDAAGIVHSFPLSENVHRDNILHTSRVPASIEPRVQRDAVECARSVIVAMDIVGVLCVEMFVTASGRVLVNEIAPRPHNSGHYSLDACDLSQFEALVRVATGLPMREPTLLSPCAMVNLLGKHLSRLDIGALLAIPGTKLHLYGKSRNEPKRKMGHVGIVGRTMEAVDRSMKSVEHLIGERSEEGSDGDAMPAVRFNG